MPVGYSNFLVWNRTENGSKIRGLLVLLAHHCRYHALILAELRVLVRYAV
jgi:hypothetical protein